MSESGEKLSVEQEQNVKELLFSGGAGCIGFMMGYLHGLIEIVGKEKLREYKLGGVSAGNAAALFFHMCLHQDEYDMKYFNEHEIAKYFRKDNRKYLGLFTNYQVIQANTKTYCTALEEFGNQIPNINGIYHCVVTEWDGKFKFKKVVLDQFENEDLLSSAIQSSCQIPFFTSPKVFKNHEGRRFLDGGFVGCIPYKYENSQKIYLNMLPKVTNFVAQFRKKTKNLKCLNIIDGHGISFPRDYYIWNEEWNHSMFLKGYLAAKHSMKEICETFGVEKVQKKVHEPKAEKVENNNNNGNDNEDTVSQTSSTLSMTESEQEAQIRKEIKEHEKQMPHTTHLLAHDIQF